MKLTDNIKKVIKKTSSISSKEVNNIVNKKIENKNINNKDIEKSFGKLAPLVKILYMATKILEEETKLIISRAPLNKLRTIALEKETLLNQHDLYLSRLGDLTSFVTNMDKRVRVRLRHVYRDFELALRMNGLRLSAALGASESLLSALSEAVLEDAPKSPQLYTPHARMSESETVSFRNEQEV